MERVEFRRIHRTVVFPPDGALGAVGAHDELVLGGSTRELARRDQQRTAEAQGALAPPDRGFDERRFEQVVMHPSEAGDALILEPEIRIDPIDCHFVMLLGVKPRPCAFVLKEGPVPVPVGRNIPAAAVLAWQFQEITVRFHAVSAISDKLAQPADGAGGSRPRETVKLSQFSHWKEISVSMSAGMPGRFAVLDCEVRGKSSIVKKKSGNTSSIRITQCPESPLWTMTGIF